MDRDASLYFYTMHKCASSLFGRFALKNVVGRTHKDYAAQIFREGVNIRIAFEETGYVYGPIRVSAGPAAPVFRPLVEPTCRSDFVRGKTAIFMVRDPRDILISGYYSYGWSHTISPVNEIAAFQRQLREGVQQFTLDDFALDKSAKTLTHFETIIRLTRACKRASVLRYEDMIHDWPTFSTALTKYAEFDDATLAEIYKRSRPRQEIKLNQHRRSGQTEQFRTELKPETVDALNEVFTPVLEHFGYDR